MHFAKDDAILSRSHIVLLTFCYYMVIKISKYMEWPFKLQRWTTRQGFISRRKVECLATSASGRLRLSETDNLFLLSCAFLHKWVQIAHLMSCNSLYDAIGTPHIVGEMAGLSFILFHIDIENNAKTNKLSGLKCEPSDNKVKHQRERALALWGWQSGGDKIIVIAASICFLSASRVVKVSINNWKQYH
jgi:hypothetical protein